MRRLAILIVVLGLSAVGASPAAAQLPETPLPDLPAPLPDLPIPEFPRWSRPNRPAMTAAAAVRFHRSKRRVLGAAAARAAAARVVAAPAVAARGLAKGLDRTLAPARHPQAGTRSRETTTALWRTALTVRQASIRPVSRHRALTARQAAAQTARPEKSLAREPTAGTPPSHRVLTMELCSARGARLTACWRASCSRS